VGSEKRVVAVTAEIEMIWETNAKASWCHVNGSPSQPVHKIAQSVFAGRVRHLCPRCGVWLEPAIIKEKA
jgi:hypothetical protein